MIKGVRRRARVFVGDTTVRNTDRALSKGDDVVVCFPWANRGHSREGEKQIMGLGKGGYVLVHAQVDVQLPQLGNTGS